jgi:exosortase
MAAQGVHLIEKTNPADDAWAHALIGIGLGLVLLLVAFNATAMELISIWSTNSTYGYAWLVLPTLTYLLWHHRRRFFACRPAWSLFGIVAAGCCGTAWVAFDLANIGLGRQFAFVAVVPCIVLAAVGWRIFTRLAQFLVLLVLLVPTGEFLLAPLKILTVNIIVVAAALARIPHSVDGTVIFAGANRYVVIDDCAGLPYVLTALFLGLTFGLLVYRAAWKVGLFALLGIGCGILANGLRVVSIVMLDWLQGTRLELSSHILFQWMAFGLGIAVMIAVLMQVASEPLDADQPPPRHGARAGRQSLKAALAATVLAISVPQIALARIESGGGQASSREASAGNLLPERFGGWTRSVAPTVWSPAPRSPMRYALARYVRGDRQIEVFVAAANQRRQKVTGYAIDLVGSRNWLEGKHARLTDCSTRSCREVSVLELDRQSSDDVREIYYVYTLDGQIVGSALELQLRCAWNDLVGAPRRARIIALATDDKGLSTDDVAEAINALAYEGAGD